MVDPNKEYPAIKPKGKMKGLLKKFGIDEKVINSVIQNSTMAIEAMSQSMSLYSGIKFDKEQNKIVYLEENDRANYYKAMNTIMEQNDKILAELKTLNEKLDKLTKNL